MGSMHTHMYVKGRGVVVSEPSVVATDMKQQSIIAVGEEALRLMRSNPEVLMPMMPLSEGFIVDYRVMLTMLTYFMHRASRTVRRARVWLAVPCGITDVECRAVTDAVIQAGAREVHLIESPVAAALGCDLPVFEACGSMVVDIGGGTTDIGVMSLGGKVVSRTARIGGQDINKAILEYIRSSFGVMVSDETVETLKIELGSAMPPRGEEEYTFTGRDVTNGLMKQLIIRRGELYEVMCEPIERIVTEVKNVFEVTPPELVADIMERGLVLTGAVASTEGLAELLTEELGVFVRVPKEPGFAVALGLGKASSEAIRMERFMVATKHRKGRA